MSLFALVDCNNFFASCERVFNPALEGKPIVVLSNNDGCIIARSNEAKQLGIPMGVPYYQWEKICKQNQVQVFSSNYELYGDLSNRVMNILNFICPQVEIYSIDEAFLQLDSLEPQNLNAFANHIRCTIKQWVGLSVSIGIAPTKTLAKIANHIAKKKMINGIFNLCDVQLQDTVLSSFSVEDIWGIGKRLSKKLKNLNIHTAKLLRDSKEKDLRKKFSVVMERTILELRGTACLSLEDIQQPRKQIICSRSFGKKIKTLSELEEALSHYTARACLKLRRQKSLASAIFVFLQTPRFSQIELQYQHSESCSLIMPSNDTSYIIKYAKLLLKKIFRPGFHYHKTGIILMDLISEKNKQLDLFHQQQSEKQIKAMQVLDTINEKFGKNTLFFCSEGTQRNWQLKCGHRSPRYTTHWDELVIAK